MSKESTNYRITETTKDIIREDMWKMMDRLVTECGVEGEALMDFMAEMIQDERAFIGDLSANSSEVA